MSANKLYATLCFIGTFIYMDTETRFFGSHILPASPEECICDGIGLIALILSVTLWAKKEPTP